MKRKLPRLAAILLTATALIPFSIHAQETAAESSPVAVERLDPAGFYGFWEFLEPAGDSSIVIIKRGGRLSSFWAGTSARAIQKGSWERTGDILTATWETGNKDVYRILGDNAVERQSFPAGTSLLGAPSLTIRGVRIDSRIPGSLRVEREGPRPVEDETLDPQSAPAIPVDNAFIGYWRVEQGGGVFGIGRGEKHFFLHLNRNGEASVALRQWDVPQASRGKWHIDNDKVIITWPGNFRDVLAPTLKGDYELGTYRAKDRLDRDPRSLMGAEKVAALDAARYFDAGSFGMLTAADIRGTWIPVQTTEQREYISIEGWGNAYRFPSASGSGGTDSGNWRLVNDRIQITWIDGSKDLIRLTPRGFVRDSFAADEAFSGVPFRSITVTRSAE